MWGGQMMKMIVSGVFGIAVAGLAFWVATTTQSVLPSPLPILILAAVYGVSPIGTFWMLYMAIRHERRPLLYIFLAFIPYSFVGYYLERVRGQAIGNDSQRSAL